MRKNAVFIAVGLVLVLCVAAITYYNWEAEASTGTSPEGVGALIAATDRKDAAIETPQLVTQAAKDGDTDAQYRLGVMYSEGEGVPQNRLLAVFWVREAAESGHKGAQLTLGMAYALGEGVPEDYTLAHMWLNLAASQGLHRAAELREAVSELMTTSQIATAQTLASEWRSPGTMLLSWVPKWVGL